MKNNTTAGSTPTPLETRIDTINRYIPWDAPEKAGILRAVNAYDALNDDHDKLSSRVIELYDEKTELVNALKRLQRWVGKYVADEHVNHNLAAKDLNYAQGIIAKAEGKGE